MSNANNIVFALFCALILSFVYGQGIPPGRSCSCTGGLTCNFTNVYCAPFDKGECRRENIALGKKSNISSLHRALNDLGNAACVGVNGNTTNHWAPLEQNPTTANCIHTSPLQSEAHSWIVDLGKNYLIRDIVLYSRITQTERMIYVSVWADRTRCHYFSQSPPRQSYYHLTCPNVTARFVRLEKLKREPNSKILQVDYCINVCEIQVWVCRQGYYGVDCNQTCDPCVHCDIVNGTCSGGCKVGHYGHRCLQICFNCVDKKCDNEGICQTGCISGFQGKKCDINITSTEAPPASTEDGGVGKYIGIGFLILALLASGLACYILATRRRKKKEEGGKGIVETAQETQTPAAPENVEPVAQEPVPKPPPESEIKSKGSYEEGSESSKWSEGSEQSEEEGVEKEIVSDAV